MIYFQASYLDSRQGANYNGTAMMIQNLLLASESYTHQNWVYQDICVGFSRLYYIIDGEAYYEEEGKAVRFRKNHLYLTPMRKCFTLYENAEDKLLHTYSHITTLPPIEKFIEIEVVDGTPLADAVALWRKHIHSNDTVLLTNIIAFVLSCIDCSLWQENSVAQKTKQYIDCLEDFSLDMMRLSHTVGYSREHITRSFLSAYHTTPKKYFNSRRMDAALQKLGADTLVKVVADDLGYASAYSFSKAFKKHFGLSPEQYIHTLK